MGLVEIISIVALVVGLAALGLAIAGFAMAKADRQAAEWERFMAKSNLDEARTTERRARELRDEAARLANAAGAEISQHPNPRLSVEIRHKADPPGAESEEDRA